MIFGEQFRKIYNLFLHYKSNKQSRPSPFLTKQNHLVNLMWFAKLILSDTDGFVIHRLIARRWGFVQRIVEQLYSSEQALHGESKEIKKQNIQRKKTQQFNYYSCVKHWLQWGTSQVGTGNTLVWHKPRYRYKTHTTYKQQLILLQTKSFN